MAKAKILVVGNESPGKSDLKSRLIRLGYSVPGVVSSGAEALQRISEIRPDLVLLDISLKAEMDGIEAARQIRDRFNIPVIYLAADADEKALERAKITEPITYVRQPFAERELQVAIEIALYKHQFEEKYRILVDHANEAIFIAQDGVVKFPNPSTLALVGYSVEELAQIPFVNLIHPEDRQMVWENHQKRLRGEDLPHIYSFRVLNRSGEEFWVQLNTVLTTWEGRPATLNYLRDITPLKKLELQFQQAQKMEAIGTLAGGIAHDFNNLLMGIQGYISLMLFNLDSTHPHYENLKKIEEHVRSGASLTSQLLGFARRGKYEVKPADLNQIIQRSSEMFERTKKEIKIYRKYQENIWIVGVDRGQIEQLLLNLYVNAWQAMPEGGNLYLETKNVTLRKDYIKPFWVQPGDYVKISVTDTGIGMDEKTKQRIFEPFFTTKAMGRGTGLGLASAYGIVKNHGGFINVYSEKGHGTTFTIYLPVREKELKEEKKVLSAELLRGTETILLVDDEDTIINVVEKSLNLLGYRVLVARGGEEAAEIYRGNQQEIALVILDMIMPGIGGGKAYDLLKEINPHVKTILSSGYSFNGEAAQIMARGCDGFIQKPFGIKELSKKIREILDKNQ